MIMKRQKLEHNLTTVKVYGKRDKEKKTMREDSCQAFVKARKGVSTGMAHAPKGHKILRSMIPHVNQQRT